MKFSTTRRNILAFMGITAAMPLAMAEAKSTPSAKKIARRKLLAQKHAKRRLVGYYGFAEAWV